MRSSPRTAIFVIGLFLMLATASQAADVKKALSETEGRKRAAENGLKEIKSKSRSTEQVRSAYELAAAKQNAWLDAVCQALERGAQSAPEVSPSSESAAMALIEWVNIRNRALTLPELTGPISDSVRMSVVRDLNEIASESWKDSRSADAKKRATTAKSLNERLRWKPFDAVP